MAARTLAIQGPPNSLRRTASRPRSNLTVSVDPTEQTARFDTQGRQFLLQQGEWSDWVRADFR